jgi:hypothetical protein
MKMGAKGIQHINYQDSVDVPLSEEADNNAAMQEGDDMAD